MKIRFTRDYLIKDLREKFNSMANSRSVEYVNTIGNVDYQVLSPTDANYVFKWEVYDKLVIDPSIRTKELCDAVDNLAGTESDLLLVISDPLNKFEPTFFRDHYDHSLFGNLPMIEFSLFGQIFYEGIFDTGLDQDFKYVSKDIMYLVKDKYIYVNDLIENSQSLLLSVNKNKEIIFPEFDDITVDVDSELLEDSEFIRKLKLKSLTEEVIF